ncbi:MAG: prolipoprotein diacylglyceryl transferase family protein [Bacteroidales bacterium]
MYPRISDLINNLLGTDISLPVQTYGFFVALAFIFAGWVVYIELRRKERESIILPHEKIRIEGKPASIQLLAINAVISFFIGYKLVGVLLNYSEFADSPQKFIFSSQGSWWGGILLAIAITLWTYFEKQKKKTAKPIEVRELIHPRQLTGNIILVAAVSGIIGAKLFDVIEHLDLLIKDPVHTLFSFSGLAFYGGLITAAFVLSVYVERNHIPWPVNADVVAPALMLAYGIGRMGCQLSGDGCWGMVNPDPKPDWLAFLPDWMWAFKYPHNVINEGGLIPGCVGRNCHVLDQPVFPTPIYETILALIFFGTLWFFRKRIKLHGVLFSVYLIMNGSERLLIEQIRVNIRYDFLGIKVTQASVIAVLLIMTGIGLIFFFKWWNRKKFIKPIINEP